MARIKIKVDAVKSTNVRLKYTAAQLCDKKNCISSVCNSIDNRITRRRNIDSRLNQTVNSLSELETRLNKIHMFIDDSMDLYVEADKKAASLKLSETNKSKLDWLSESINFIYDVDRGFKLGVVDTLISTAEGTWNMVVHPIETCKGIVFAVQHPITIGESILNSVANSWDRDVINGDVRSASHWFGRAFGEGALAVVGTKGIDKVVKLNKGVSVTAKNIETLEEAAVWGETNYKKWHKSLSQDDKDIIFQYTGADYRVFNKFLRGEYDSLRNTYVDLEKIDHLNEILATAKIPHDITLYRGTDIDSIKEMLKKNKFGDEMNVENLVGNVFRENAFMSTSMLKDNYFMQKEVNWTIDVPEGANGGFIPNISRYPEEAEILFNTGQEFLIKEAFVDANGRVQLLVEFSRK